MERAERLKERYHTDPVFRAAVVARNKKYRATKKGADYTRDWQRKTENKLKARGIKLKYKYGITLEVWEALFAAQDRRCPVCKSETSGGLGWHTDHNHNTGRVRGILCQGCNMALGQLKEDPARIRALAAYVEASLAAVGT